MISYIDFSSDKLYDLIHNYSYLKELYKINFDVSKVPPVYSQEIKDVLFRNYPNSHVFLALKDNTPIAFLTGSYDKNSKSFTIDNVVVSKKLSIEEQNLIVGKIMLRAVSHARVKEKAVNFSPGIVLSKETKEIFKKIFSRNKTKTSLNYVPDKRFFSKKESFSVFKKDKVKRIKK